MKGPFHTIALLAAVLFSSCNPAGHDPYEGYVFDLTVELDYGGDYASFVRAGVDLRAEDVNLGYAYLRSTDGEGRAHFRLPAGLYRISASDRDGEDVFNATTDRYSLISSGQKLVLKMKHSRAGSLVIKEIYSGGCRKAPAEGNYQADQYVIIHNNDLQTRYLDSLCFGTLHPYNATASNPFLVRDAEGNDRLPDFVPIADAVWQFGGDGHTFPLQPGEDAVLCIRGAIDHAASYPLSVNLNRKGYFVMYDANLFPNKDYNPVPGSEIEQDHILHCLTKTNPSINATMISMASPTAVLYRAKGVTMQEYIATEGAIVPIPGSANGSKVLACPPEWVLDAVEVFTASSSTNVKRLLDELDAGYVFLSAVYDSRVVARKRDEKASEEAGYEVLADSNNSSEDFVELEKQSLRE